MAAQYLILQASSQRPSSLVFTLMSFQMKSGPSLSAHNVKKRFMMDDSDFGQRIPVLI